MVQAADEDSTLSSKSSVTSVMVKTLVSPRQQTNNTNSQFHSCLKGMVPPAPKTSTGGVYRSFSIADNNLVGLVFNLPLACGRTALSGLTKFYHSLTFLT